MATAAEIEEVRRNTGVATDAWSDVQLSTLIDSLGSLELAAASVWNAIAAESASLVDTAESGSSRKLGDVHKNAITMAKYYRDLAASSGGVAVDGVARTRTRSITRS